jgi:hypothetical protein
MCGWTLRERKRERGSIDGTCMPVFHRYRVGFSVESSENEILYRLRYYYNIVDHIHSQFA